jgi:hypothetical protein
MADMTDKEFWKHHVAVGAELEKAADTDPVAALAVHLCLRTFSSPFFPMRYCSDKPGETSAVVETRCRQYSVVIWTKSELTWMRSLLKGPNRVIVERLYPKAVPPRVLAHDLLLQQQKHEEGHQPL